jgi:hypothetical protein
MFKSFNNLFENLHSNFRLLPFTNIDSAKATFAEDVIFVPIVGGFLQLMIRNLINFALDFFRKHIRLSCKEIPHELNNCGVNYQSATTRVVFSKVFSRGACLSWTHSSCNITTKAFWTSFIAVVFWNPKRC